MLNEQHGDLEHIADLHDILHQFCGLGGIHACRRLIQQQQAGIGSQRPDDLQPPLCAVRQGPGLHIGHMLHIKDAQQLQRPLMGDSFLFPIFGQPENAGQHRVSFLVMQPDLDVVLHGQVGKQPDILKGPGDAHAVDLNGAFPGGIDAVQQNSASGWLIHLGQQIEHGGFPRAVRPDEPGDLCAPDGEVEVVHGPQTAEIDAQMAAFQNRGFPNIPVGDNRMAGDGDHVGLFKFLTH